MTTCDDFWRLCNDFMTTLWWLCDNFVSVLWRLCDNFAMTLWQLCGDFVATCDNLLQLMTLWLEMAMINLWNINLKILIKYWMNWKKMEKCDKQKTDGLTDNVSRHAPLKMLLIQELSYSFEISQYCKFDPRWHIYLDYLICMECTNFHTNIIYLLHTN